MREEIYLVHAFPTLTVALTGLNFSMDVYFLVVRSQLIEGLASPPLLFLT